MKTYWSKAVVVAAALALMAACGGSGGGGGGSTDDDVCGGATLGCVSGVVQDSTGAAIGSIVVTSEAAPAAQIVGKAASNLTTTNSQGWFSATGLAEGEQVICFESPTGATTQYVKKCKKVTITAKENTPLPATKMALRAAGDTITGVEAGGTATGPGDTGAAIQFDAGEVCASDGTTPITGDIICYLTAIDVTDASTLETAPDTFVAIATGGAQGTMVSSAMMEVTCEQNGEKLQICSGKKATVFIPIYGTDAECKDNTLNPTPIEAWFFNDSTGDWGEYTSGTFAKACGGVPPGTAGANQWYTGEIDHMTWINGDKWKPDVCLTGLVYLSAGEVTGSNVTVSCYGVGWRNEVQVNNGGRFCIPVPAGYAYTCKVGDSSRWIDAADYISGTAPAAPTVTFPLDACPAADCIETSGFIFASPILSTTLTWGLAPRDLDSHTIGSGVHVYFVDKDNDATKGSLTAAPYVALDTDDVDSYGPEVTTVMPSVADGKYCFYVYNFSGESNMSDASTDQNGAAKSATVTVIGEGISKTYTIPSSNPSDYDYWKLYTVEFEGGAVKSDSFKSVDTLAESEPTDCSW